LSKEQPQQRASFWVWVPLGLALGLFVTFILFLDGKKQTNQQDVKVVKEKLNAKSDRAKPVFDFYTVLPDRVVDVKTKEPSSQQANAHQKPKVFQKYILQVGSFNNFSDADELKAKLAFLGLEARLAKANVKNSTWYRVQLGPFKSSSGLSKTKNLLIQNKIKYLQKNAS